VQHEADVESLLVAADEAVARGDDVGDQSRHLAGGRLVQAPPVWESLQLVVAAIREVDLDHGPDQLADDLGDENLPAFRPARDTVNPRIDSRLVDPSTSVNMIETVPSV